MSALYTAHQSREIDRYAIEQLGIPGILLMKRAAMAALQHIQRHFPEAQHLHIACGVGNNGGDGYLLGQLAVMSGYEVTLSQVGPTHKIKGDALTALHELVDCDLNPYPLTDKALQGCELIVDALLGTGLSRPVEGDYAEAIQRLNRHSEQNGTPIFSLDVPSGLNATTGQVMGVAIKAHHTLSFIVEKMGLYQEAGKDHAGQRFCHDLYLSDILPQIPVTPMSQKLSVITKALSQRWQNRPENWHKGNAGTAVLIGGNHHMMGAIALAGKAALRSGAGRVKIISQTEHLIALTQMQPELMTYEAKNWQQHFTNAAAIAIGPGLGQDKWSMTALSAVFEQLKGDAKKAIPTVIDADALNLLAQMIDTAFTFPENTLFTPHPAEAARLLKTSVDAVQHDRIEAVEMLHETYGGVWILKGAGTLIYDGKTLCINDTGNSGMATGGMGDVLTGLLAGLLAQGFSPLEAAQLGVWLHGHQADRWIKNHPKPSLLPTDLIQ